MALLQKKKINDLVVTNNEHEIVTQVFVEWHTYDTMDPEEFSIKETKVFNLEVDEVDPTSKNFIPFGELTEEIVTKWLEERFQSPRIKQMEERMKQDISNRVNPPAPQQPTEINKGLPWQNS
jgi:hypothetical protein